MNDFKREIRQIAEYVEKKESTEKGTLYTISSKLASVLQKSEKEV